MLSIPEKVLAEMQMEKTRWRRIRLRLTYFATGMKKEADEALKEIYAFRGE